MIPDVSALKHSFCTSVCNIENFMISDVMRRFGPETIKEEYVILKIS
jgi:hypothetical protein